MPLNPDPQPIPIGTPTKITATRIPNHAEPAKVTSVLTGKVSQGTIRAGFSARPDVMTDPGRVVPSKFGADPRKATAPAPAREPTIQQANALETTPVTMTEGLVEPATPQAPPPSPAQANVEPPSETPKAEGSETPKAPEKKEPFENQWAKLTSKEAAVRAERQALKAEQAALQADRQRIKAWDEHAQKIKTDPIAFLKQVGIPWSQVIDAALKNPDGLPNEKDALAAQVAQQQRDIDAYKQNEQAKLERERNTLIQTEVNIHKASARSFVKAHADTYKLINLQDASDVITETVVAEYNRTQKLLTLDQAANKVEAYLKSEADKLRPYFQPSAPEANPSTPAISAAPVTKTITNNQSAANIISDEPRKQYRSRQEKLAMGLKRYRLRQTT